ncbi:uncharacterized protein LOC132627480 [Lycium barbarum]|uniref:uncharacterized protein LOC132627480 n=1 Tax=Lycium barbarum TaxID=112863 RepID=UPI00293E63E8|nr:uncharacterized protein LOC132627480 [Lycium barbarum]
MASPSSKKPKNRVEEEETLDDRISQLPDSLLIQILSLLWTKDTVSSCVLSKSCCEFHQVFRNLVLDYLQKLTYATELIIGNWFAKVVFVLQLERVPLPQLRCKCLTVEIHTKYTSYGVTSLLRTSPCLETLNIDMGDWFLDVHCQLERSYLAKGDNINLQSWMSKIVFPNLKNVNICCTIKCVKGRFEGDNDKLFELSVFLLKYAMALKKFVMVSKTRICRICSENCASQYLSQLTKQLLDNPKSSRNVMITFQEFLA